MSGNFWLNKKMKRDLHKQIEELALDVWAEDGTLGELLSVLDDAQIQFLYNMKLKNFESDDEEELGFVFEVTEQ